MIKSKKYRFIAAVFLILLLGRAVFFLYWDTKITQDLIEVKKANNEKIVAMRSEEGLRIEVDEVLIRFPLKLTAKLHKDGKGFTGFFRWDRTYLYPESILSLESSSFVERFVVEAQFSDRFSQKSWFQFEENRKKEIEKSNLKKRESVYFPNMKEFVNSKGNSVSFMLKNEDGSYNFRSFVFCGGGLTCMKTMHVTPSLGVRLIFKKNILNYYPRFLHDMSNFFTDITTINLNEEIANGDSK